MPTKKPSSPKSIEPRAERGRYARILSDGYAVHVAPSPKTKGAIPEGPRPRPASVEAGRLQFRQIHARAALSVLSGRWTCRRGPQSAGGSIRAQQRRSVRRSCESVRFAAPSRRSHRSCPIRGSSPPTGMPHCAEWAERLLVQLGKIGQRLCRIHVASSSSLDRPAARASIVATTSASVALRTRPLISRNVARAMNPIRLLPSA